MKKSLFLAFGLFILCAFSAAGYSEPVAQNQVNTQTIQEVQEVQEIQATQQVQDIQQQTQNDVQAVQTNQDSQLSQELLVTFLDVGQADCTLLQCGDEAMLIDGGNPDDAQKIYSILKQKEITNLKAIIITHLHSDHYGGLAAALTACTADTVYAPGKDCDTEAFQDILERAEITIPQVGTGFTLGSAKVEIIGPINDYEDINNTSLVCKVTNGKDTFLFTGDMEREAELDLIEAGTTLSADVLKVGHHGSDSSTSYVFLREIMPKYAVISCGKDNSYGHPTETVLSRLNDAEAIIYRTDLQGDIYAISSGDGIQFTTSTTNNTDIQPVTPVVQEEAITYIGNKNSKVFHLPTCKSLPLEKNRIYLDSRQEALANNFRPCGNCNP